MKPVEVMTSPAQVAVALDPATAEFNQTLADMEAYNKKKADDAAKLAELTKQSEEKAKPIPKPIMLEYRFSGVDSEGHEVVTLEMDVGDRHFVTAFCVIEKKQIISKEVANLYDPKDMQNLQKGNEILPKLPKKK